MNFDEEQLKELLMLIKLVPLDEPEVTEKVIKYINLLSNRDVK